MPFEISQGLEDDSNHKTQSMHIYIYIYICICVYIYIYICISYTHMYNWKPTVVSAASCFALAPLEFSLCPRWLVHVHLLGRIQWLITSKIQWLLGSGRTSGMSDNSERAISLSLSLSLYIYIYIYHQPCATPPPLGKSEPKRDPKSSLRDEPSVWLYSVTGSLSGEVHAAC